MKLVTAIIKPFKLDAVRDALAEVGVQDITVIPCDVWAPLLLPISIIALESNDFNNSPFIPIILPVDEINRAMCPFCKQEKEPC